MRKNRRTIIVIFIVYLGLLAYFLFFSERMGREPGEEYMVNLVPFREIRRFAAYAKYFGEKRFRLFALNIIGNVAAFIPFGLLLPTVRSRRHYFGHALASGILFSLLIETVQLVTRVGTFDVDDIMLNAAGCVIGYLLFRLLQLRGRRSADV